MESMAKMIKAMNKNSKKGLSGKRADKVTAKVMAIIMQIVNDRIPQPKNFELGIFRLIPTIEWARVLKYV